MKFHWNNVTAFCTIAQCTCFLNTASSLFLWHNLAHFGIPYLCPLNPCKSRPSEGNDQAIKDNFADVLNCTYLNTKLLNSYPTLKLREWVLVSIMVTCGHNFVTAGLLLPLNKSLVHEAHLRLEFQITWISRNASQKRMGNYANCMSNALPVSKDVHYCLYYHVSWVFVLPVYHLAALCWSTGSLKHVQHDCQ